MTNAHEKNHPHPESLPADVRDLAGRLDTLASLDRAAAPTGLEDRLLAAARSGIGSHTTIAGVVKTRNPWAGLRLAAALGVVGGAGLLAAVYVIGARNTGVSPNAPIAVVPTPAQDPLDVEAISAEFEEYLAAVDGSDSESAGSTIGTSADGFWDIGNAVTQEGSL